MIATRGAAFQRGEIANANRDFEQLIQQSLGADLNRALNRTLPPNDRFRSGRRQNRGPMSVREANAN